ncbi:MAG: hypothetical protein HKN68_10780 [Saprospiraceae bacterium]|nr:hypothetical protein [Saprospiraceae bacterium]
MKKTIILILMMSFSVGIWAQNPYVESMMKGMELIKKAQGKDQYITAANHFDRIAQVEKEQWHPAYHAAFSKAIAATQVSDPSMIEEFLDGAQSSLDNASSIIDNHSEILALQGFIHMLRIGVDPMTRAQQYSGMSSASLQKAIALDENNPRAIFLLAQLSYGTAQFFGSGTEEACQLNEKALALFAAEEKNKKDASFDPQWGRNMSESFKEQCAN